MNKCSHSLWYNKSANNFNEALPLGNGRIGAMVYGGGAEETISLNEDTLWSGYPRRSEKEVSHIWKQVQLLAEQQRYPEAQALLEKDFADFNSQVYLPLGKLRIHTEDAGQVTELSRQLRLDTACHSVRYRCERGTYLQECFISHPHQVLVLRIAEESGLPVSLCVTLEGSLQCTHTTGADALYIEGNCPDRTGLASDPNHGYTYHTEPSKMGVGYYAGVRAVTVGGSVALDGGCLRITDAKQAFLYFAVRTSFNGPFLSPVTKGREYIQPCLADLDQAAKLGYDRLLEAHLQSHSELYDRCSLDLGTSPISSLPTDERLLRHRSGEYDPALYALLFHFGRYLMIASSRPGTQATNLQGIWNEKLTPPWNSNYTLNINTEMNYWPVMSANLGECSQPLVQLLKELHLAGQHTARNYYGAPGFCVHHNSDLWRTTHPVCPNTKNSCQWSQWPMSAGWLCRMAYDLYRYNRDETYLRQILPILEDGAAFYTNLLRERDGGLMVLPSTSPENNYLRDGERCPLDDTATMSVAITRDVLRCTAEAREHFGLDSSDLRATCSRLLPYRIHSEGTLNEWYGEHEDFEVHHRHVSHLYGLYPSEQINWDMPALLDACRATLEKRGDESTGWSLAWKISLWARLRDGDRAQRLLDLQLVPVDSSIDAAVTLGGSYTNLFCAHPPFQIDGNFGACAGILEMLVQTDKNGEPILLPALPKQWANGKLTGMRLPGNRVLSMAWQDGTVTDCSIVEL